MAERGPLDSELQWYGLRTDLSDCATITVHGLPPEMKIGRQGTLPLEPQNRETLTSKPAAQCLTTRPI